MSLLAYRRVLALPGVPASLVLMFVARIPMTAMGITLTLHVVTELGHGYGAAGLIGTMTTAGTALGAPLIGRMIDRYGLRPIVATCTITSAAYWTSAPHLPYPLLLAIALPAGLLAIPAGAIGRQVLTALVPGEQRRSAFSLDSMSVEVSFMIGPAAGILLTTQVSSTVALTAIGLGFGLVGVAMWWLNPAVRTLDEAAVHLSARPAVRTWLTPLMGKALLVAVGALFVLVGTELATLAMLQEADQVSLTTVVLVIMCAASMLGGLVHGAVRRSLSQMTLTLLLAVLTLPVGLAGHSWWLLALAAIPMNLVCAPTLAATSESVSKLAPARVRGEAIGVQDAATRFGLALGAPVVGFVIDHSSAAWGFAASGLGGLLFAAAAWWVGRRAWGADTTDSGADTTAWSADTRAWSADTAARGQR